MLKNRSGPFLMILAVALLVAVPLRVCLILFDIDPKTGFYIGGSRWVLLLNGLLVAFTVLLLIPLGMKKSLRDVRARLHGTRTSGVLTALLAAAFLTDAGYEFFLVMADRTAGNLFTSFAALAAGCFFAALAVSHLRGRSTAYPFGALLPTLWAIIHLMVSFMHYTTIVNVSEYLYDMLKMVFMMIFLYYYSRCAGNVSNRMETRGMLAFGLPAVLFAMVSTLPRYIAWLCGNRGVSLAVPEDLVFTLLSVYILVVLTGIFRHGPEPPETSEQ